MLFSCLTHIQTSCLLYKFLIQSKSQGIQKQVRGLGCLVQGCLQVKLQACIKPTSFGLNVEHTLTAMLGCMLVDQG